MSLTATFIPSVQNTVKSVHLAKENGGRGIPSTALFRNSRHIANFPSFDPYTGSPVDFTTRSQVHRKPYR
jgi:hypothetical protein